MLAEEGTRSPQGGRARHPFYWAGFVLIGDGM
jgi:CHAT domain-containing protein